MFLLDTNVLSELRKARLGRADERVVAWAGAQAADEQFVSVVTLGELERGVLLKERRDPRQGAVLRKWLDADILPGFEGRTLPIDRAVAVRAAALHVPDPRGAYDALIAATALVHGLTVVTRNTDDFAAMNVRLLDPWDDRS